jgi:hypothetical protein
VLAVLTYSKDNVAELGPCAGAARFVEPVDDDRGTCGRSARLLAMPGPSTIPPQLVTGPFLAQEAVLLGVAPHVLRGQRFRSVHRSVYVSADLPDTLELRMDAARLVLPPAAVFSHHTAAELRGLPVPADDRVHVTIPYGTKRPAVRGIVVHEGMLDDATVLRRGRPVTTAERTFVDLAAALGLVDLVVLGDAMLRTGAATRDGLTALAYGTRQRKGIRVARRASTLVRPRVDSPMETRVRLLIVLAGLPCPAPGGEVLDEHGQWVATVDMRYQEQRIAIEYDGDLHRTNKRKWRNDVRARDALHRLGWDVIVLTADDLYARPLQTLWRIQEALQDRGHPGVPDQLNPGWEIHFPVRRLATAHW